MSTVKQKGLRRFNAWLRSVGKSRDGILVVGGALYILGYMVWSVNAYIKGLGLLPAFESQYFIAGAVPFLIFFLAYRLIRFSWARKLPRWLNIWEARKGWESLLKTLLPLAFVGSALISKTGISKYLVGKTMLIGGIVAGVAGLLVILAIFSIDPGSPDPLKLPTMASETKWKKLGGIILVGARLIIIVVAGVLALVFYVGLLYSKLPQSLGGVRPRCAYLDIEKKGVSQLTLSAVSPASALPSSPDAQTVNPTSGEPEIVLSDKLEVLFSGSDFVLIRVRGEVFEIKKEIIHAVRACE